jgi:hypothetical protein
MIIEEVVLPNLCAELDRVFFENWDPTSGPFEPTFERLARDGDRSKLERYLVSEMVSYQTLYVPFDHYRLSKHQLVKVLRNLWGGPDHPNNQRVFSFLADRLNEVKKAREERD